MSLMDKATLDAMERNMEERRYLPLPGGRSLFRHVRALEAQVAALREAGQETYRILAARIASENPGAPSMALERHEALASWRTIAGEATP